MVNIDYQKYMHCIGHPSILLVDDEEQVLKSLKRLLRREWQVYTANNGEEALHLLQENVIHIVLSDQRMPIMTGTELLYKVREYNSDIICILLTGYSDIQTVIDAINKNVVYRYLTKPWEIGELNTTLHHAFEKHTLLLQNKALLEELQDANNSLEKKVEERTEQLIEANEYLKTLNAQKNMFLSMACHDLRSPLNAVMSIAWILLKQEDEYSKTKIQKILTIYNNSKSMLNIIENFINIAIIESGKINIKKVKLSIYDLLGKLLDSQEILAEERKFKIAVDLEQNLPDIHVDEQRIVQVFNNLLANAYKFAPPDTIITIQCRKKTSAVEFSIIDQGEPIPTSQIEKIFSAFERSNHNYMKAEGIGLGLFICKEMITLHGGTVSVKSEEGEGNHFIFTIPITPIENPDCSEK